MIAMFLLVASPVAAVQYNPIEASQSRCTRASNAREQARCKAKNNRLERSRLWKTSNAFNRGNLLREKRKLPVFTRNKSIRARGNARLAKLRLRSNSTVRSARRTIKTRNENARNACKALEGTDRFLCIRKRTWQSTRGGVQ